MWNNEENKKKEYKKREVIKPLPQEPKPQIKLTDSDLMTSEEVFRHSFLNSEEIRNAHGFSMKSGKLILLNKTWIESTADKEKVEWIRKIFKEKNGVKQ